MAMKRRFVKVAASPVGLAAILPSRYSNRWSEVNGDKRSPNPFTLRKAEYLWSHSTRVEMDRRSWYDPEVTVVSPGADNEGLVSFSSITEYDTSAPQLGETHISRNIAVARMIDGIKANDWNAAVSIAEMSESWKMIVSSATRLYAAARALKKGRLGDMYAALGIPPNPRYGRAGKRRYPPAKTVRTNASSYWLEVNLGWQPLIQDIFDGAEAIAKAIYAPANPRVAKVRGRGTYSRPVITSKIPGNNIWNEGLSTYSVDIRSEVACYYTYDSPTIALARSFGFTNPMALAWETFPLSFVFDYVCNIGDWLENLTAYQGLTFHSGYETHCCTQLSLRTRPGKGKWYEVWSTNPSHGDYVSMRRSNNGGTYYAIKTFSMSRSVLTAFPRPSPPKTYKGWKEDRGEKRAVTLLSLFRQFTSTK